MAALGSALSSQLRAPAPAAWRGKKQARASRAQPVRATANKIEDVAAAVDPKDLLPPGLYCESFNRAKRRPTRCVPLHDAGDARRRDRRARDRVEMTRAEASFFSAPRW
jgi:hypothetical protein